MGRPTASLPQTPQAFPGTHPGQQSPHSPPCLHFLSPLLIFLVSTELSKQIGASPRWTKRFGGLGHKAELRGFSPGAGIAGRGLGRPARFQLAGLGKGCGRDRRGRGLSFTPEAAVTPAAGNGEEGGGHGGCCSLRVEHFQLHPEASGSPDLVNGSGGWNRAVSGECRFLAAMPLCVHTGRGRGLGPLLRH